MEEGEPEKDSVTTQQTSLRYLRLQNGFRNMLKSGLERVDEQGFVARFKGQVAQHQLQPLWQLVQKQREAILRVAMEEMQAACDEVGVQHQLEELEALILQRGLMTNDSAAQESATLPSAAEAAVRVAAKQAEKQQLQQQLQEVLQQKESVEAELQRKQQQANDLLQDFDRSVGDQVDKVYKAVKLWMQPGQRENQQQEGAMEQ